MPGTNGPFGGVPQPQAGGRIFVAGTGTDVGKTFLSCAILRTWRDAGLKPLGLKPIMSGFDPADAEGSDAGKLLAAVGEAVDAAALDRIAPWRFRAPLSPDMAAAREGRTVSLKEVVAFSRSALAAADGPVLIESAGGIMSPLTETETMLDWAAALGIPVLLVTGNYLGAISHTLTALYALRCASVPALAVAVNGGLDAGVPLEETLASLRAHAPGTHFLGFADAQSAERCAADILGLAEPALSP